MALTPENETDLIETSAATEDQPAPSKTWRIDFENGRIGGVIDEKEAIKQYVAKALKTARLRFLIYSDQYGNELEDLIGGNVTPAFLDAELPRMIREALIYDDRIDEVRNITYTRDGDTLYITLTVTSIFGDVETEVTI